MTYYIHPDLPGFRSPGRFVLEDILYPRDWWFGSSEAEITALGFVEHVPSLEERRAEVKAAIEAEGHRRRRQGFRWNFGTEAAPNWQVLQLREPGTPTPSNDDEKNWSASLGAYTTAIVAGRGDVDGAPFRTEANETLMLTFAEGAGVLSAMFAWIAALLQVVWNKKDQAEAATDQAGLDLIEIEIANGWPA